MNPVDHVREMMSRTGLHIANLSPSLTAVVIINISARLPQFLDMLHKVKKPVSLLREGLVF